MLELCSRALKRKIKKEKLLTRSHFPQNIYQKRKFCKKIFKYICRGKCENIKIFMQIKQKEEEM